MVDWYKGQLHSSKASIQLLGDCTDSSRSRSIMFMDLVDACGIKSRVVVGHPTDKKSLDSMWVVVLMNNECGDAC